MTRKTLKWRDTLVTPVSINYLLSESKVVEAPGVEPGSENLPFICLHAFP